MKLNDTKIKLLNYLWLPKQNQKGFTLLELLVACLVVTFFAAFALQGMVLASLAQIRAREAAEASLIIQENLEQIRVAATNYNPTDLKDRCKGIGGQGKDGLADGLRDEVIDNANLDIPATFTSAASNYSYPFIRTLNPNTNNKNVLEITYNITDPNTLRSLAQLSTEVIPNVAFQCP